MNEKDLNSLHQDEQNEKNRRENMINQIRPDSKNAKKTSIQNENLINEGGTGEKNEYEEVDKKGVHHGPVVEAHAYKGETHGGALSSREAIEYTDEKGRVHRGFFTPEKKEKSFAADWEVAKKKALAGSMKYFSIIQKIAGTPEMVDNLAEAGYKDYANGNYRGTDEWLRSHYALFEVGDKAFVRIIRELAVEAWRLKNQHSLYRENGIEEGDIIAKRASAMTDVALELGYPELLANSYRLTLLRNGKKIRGVFIEEAELDTVDRSNLSSDNPIHDVSEEEFDNPQMLKTLADLQILDYLCGNIDRHSGNFFIRQDRTDPKKPHLIGVQGIDNDLSFCVTDGGAQELAKEEDLLVISSEMAKAILELKNGKLTEIMKKNGITNEKQINSALGRLEKLKGRINKRYKIIEEREIKFKETAEEKKRDQTKEDFLYEPRLKTEELQLKDKTMQNSQGEYVPYVVTEVKLEEDPKSILIVENDDYWKKLNLAKLAPSEYILDKKQNLWMKNKKPRKNIFGQAQRVREKIKLAKELARVEKEKERENPDKQKSPKSQGIRYTKHTLIPELDQTRNMIMEEYRHYCDIQEKFRNADGENPERSEYFKQMKDAYENIIRKYKEVLSDLEELEKDSVQTKTSGRLNKLKGGFVQTKTRSRLDIFYNDLYEACKIAKGSTKRYLENADGKWFKNADYKTRIEIAGELKAAVSNTASMKLFKNQLKYQQRIQDELAKKEGTKISDFMKEQMFGMMSDTLYQNVKALPDNDPNIQKGIDAFRAQQRLWEYSKTQWKPEAQAIQGENENKARQALKDMKIILEYAPGLKDGMEKRIAGREGWNKEGLTPIQALKVLDVLYQREYQIARERRQTELGVEKKNAPEKEHSHANVQKGKGRIH